MPASEDQQPAAEGRDGTRARPRGASSLATHLLGRLGLAGASAVLVAIAVLAAEVVHALILTIRGAPYQLQFVIEVALVTLVVATPIIIYAQLVIRQLARSRRALKQMTERLAIAVDGA